MQDTTYEDAWAEGDERAAPVENAVKKAAEEKRDAEAKEFSDAFFADEQKAAPEEKPVATKEQVA